MDPELFPNNVVWPQVGMIRTFFPRLQGSALVGSGTLIHPKLVLTAAHNLWDWSRGGKTSSVEVTFGGGQIVTSNASDVVQEWKDTTNNDENSMSPLSAFDCGIIILDDANATILAGVVPARVQQTTMDEIRNVTVGVVGYPSDPRRRDLFMHQAWGSGPATDVTDPRTEYRVGYPTNSLKGMSGGPTYTVSASASLEIRAVNTSSYPSAAGVPMGNGLLIYPALADKIDRWLRAV